MTRVQLPTNGRGKGCYGLDFPDGSRYTTTPGGTVDVAPHHAEQIRTSTSAKMGLISSNSQTSIGTRKGRWCMLHKPPRLWNAWSVECPKCGEPTTEER